MGFWEIVVILLLALLLFGPKRLPEIGRTLGRTLSELRRASNELRRSIDTEIDLEERPPAARRERPQGSDAAAPPEAPRSPEAPAPAEPPGAEPRS